MCKKAAKHDENFLIMCIFALENFSIMCKMKIKEGPKV